MNIFCFDKDNLDVTWFLELDKKTKTVQIRIIDEDKNVHIIEMSERVAKRLDSLISSASIDMDKEYITEKNKTVLKDYLEILLKKGGE